MEHKAKEAQGLVTWLKRALYAVTGRTGFCTVFLLLWFFQRYYVQQYGDILTHILFPWAAALAFPILTLRRMPKRKGFPFLIALFVWYLVCCFYNRQYSFYLNEPFWYQLIFAFFLFYPQEEDGRTLQRMKTVLYPFMAGYVVLCFAGVWAALSDVYIPNAGGSALGIAAGSGFRIELWCQPNVAGAIAAISGLLSGFFLFHSGRVERVLHGCNIVVTVLTLALTQSRTTAVAWSFCLALLAGRALFYSRISRRTAVRAVCAALASVVVMGTGWVGLKEICAGSLAVISRIRAAAPVQEAPASDPMAPADEAVQDLLTTDVPEPLMESTVAPTPVETPAQADAQDGADSQLESRDYGSMGEVMPRIHVWLGSLRMLADRPDTLLFGVTRKGLWENVGAYEPEMYALTHLHNAYLQTLVAGGLPSLLLLIAFGVVVGKRAFKLLFGRGGVRGGFMLSLALVLVLVCCTMESYIIFSEDLINVLFFFVCGCVMSLSREAA